MNVQKYKIRKTRKKKHDIKESVKKKRKISVLITSNEQEFTVKKNKNKLMAIEQFITKGDDALKSKDYLGAISYYSQAIKENPQAFSPYLKRSTAYQKLKNNDKAKADISSAFSIATEKAKE